MVERVVNKGEQTHKFGANIRAIHTGQKFDENNKRAITHAQIVKDKRKAFLIQVTQKSQTIEIGWIPKSICRIDKEFIPALDAERLVVYVPLWFAAKIKLDKKLEGVKQ